MAFATRTLRDDTVADQGVIGATSGGTVVVHLDHSGDSATSVALDASALSGHANGAKLNITRAWWGLSGSVEIQFKGASSDTHALRLAGSGEYTAGPAIKNGATNGGATSGDLESIGASATGFIILELRKDEAFTG